MKPSKKKKKRSYNLVDPWPNFLPHQIVEYSARWTLCTRQFTAPGRAIEDETDSTSSCHVSTNLSLILGVTSSTRSPNEWNFPSFESFELTRCVKVLEKRRGGEVQTKISGQKIRLRLRFESWWKLNYTYSGLAINVRTRRYWNCYSFNEKVIILNSSNWYREIIDRTKLGLVLKLEKCL